MDSIERRKKLEEMRGNLAQIDCDGPTRHELKEMKEVLEKLLDFLKEEEYFIQAQSYRGSGDENP